MSKTVQMLGFKGPSQGKSTLGIFRFDYGKASSDKKVPDPVGSGVFVLQKLMSLGRRYFGMQQGYLMRLVQ
jgi:hypothetical protein